MNNYHLNSSIKAKKLKLVSLIKTTIFTLSLILAFPLSAATYKVTFTGRWNASHIVSGSLPDDAHLTTLIGATHQSGKPLWSPSTLASLGIKNVAEQGDISQLMNEINSAITVGTAHSQILSDSISNFPESNSTTFEVPSSHSSISFVSMIAPSSDWFIGVYDVSLKQNGNWMQTLSIDLTPWDAGTKEGDDLDFGLSASNPQQLISKITGFPFIGSPIIANLTFERIDSEPPVNNVSAVCEMGVDPQVIKPNEGTALWWWTQNAISGSIDNGISQPTTAQNWVWIYPSEATTFKMNVTAADGSVSSCETTLRVENATSSEPADCALGTDPEIIQAGEGTALWWWTQNASSASINGFNNIQLSQNYIWLYPTQTTTYKITAMNNDGLVTECETTLIVQ
ncbi:MAG: spondin domain-containing protein [Methylococcales bacterium]|nr:spondin domain-containing protein [Methylococcales bacterium]